VSNFIPAKTRRGYYELLGERVDILYDAMDPEMLITSEIQDWKGRTVVSCECRGVVLKRVPLMKTTVCADNETSIKIRKAVRKMLDKDIYLE